MRTLFLRPEAPNERFGLGPFFRIEPLGLEYIAAALETAGHEAVVYDARFSPRIERLLRRHRPQIVGIAAAHTLDTDAVIAAARRVKSHDPTIVTIVGGHAAAVHPEPFQDPSVDAICLSDGERAVPWAVEAVARRAPLTEVPGLLARVDRDDAGSPAFAAGPAPGERVGLDEHPLPARHRLASGHRHYLCVQRRPVWLVETSRGCPYRCDFCSIWEHAGRSYRLRSPDWVCRDLDRVGGNVFVADDLFWHPPDRSRDLLEWIRRSGIRKDWMLVQTRTDLAARNAILLEAWRPMARHFDIFFGFESPTNDGLDRLTKDAGVEATVEAVRVCRRLGFGVTGNFIVDPEWDEGDFEALWDFTDGLRLDHVGFTILTPLPGTRYHEKTRHRIVERDWSRYDMHHIMWEPRLGRQRFFELFAETWRRTALRVRDPRHLWSYLRQVSPGQVPFLIKVLNRSRRLLDPDAYLAEAFPAGAACGGALVADAAEAGATRRVSGNGRPSA